jgi:hypothetical protein
MIHFSRSAAKITAAGSEGGGVVTRRSLGARLEEARLRKKKKKKKKEEVKRKDGRWEEGTKESSRHETRCGRSRRRG